ncbi:MAG: EamA family transporter RarD [Actinomyces sp.]|uniref:EamA family transporter RarD n=1 Tax=Actinomycetaceae TaxID=2049 RepID=UPI0008A19E9E|nr:MULTISPECIES: EamA family transporter RarD [Actinomycetaceae]MDK7143838.1 EamA family transporter RarD [Gleimia europaea]MDU4832042.1 EamA family transporter RarD [Actinomyces sp.]MDU6679591.1 EamA family transporter RarD [Actinomyces sp.]
MAGRGVVVSLLSSVMFAAIAFVAGQLPALSGTQVWAWRIVLTVPGILFLLAVSGRWFWFSGEFKRTIAAPKKLLAYGFNVPMLASQMFLFGWAPQTGNTLALSMGYFLMPLVMVLFGRVIFKERLSTITFIATLVACAAVVFEVIRGGGLGWVTVYVAVGYPIYFVLRRIFETDGVGALTWEMALAMPLAIYAASRQNGVSIAFSHLPAAILLLTLGGLSVFALIFYVMAAKLLPYAVFGLLSYVEPILVTVVATLLGERIEGLEWVTYIGIWLAVVILGLDGVRAIMRRKSWAVPAARPWRRRRPRKSKNEAHSWRRFRKTSSNTLVDPGAPDAAAIPIPNEWNENGAAQTD